MTNKASLHEPDAELLSAEDAIEDAERLRAWLRNRRASEQHVQLDIPLRVLLEAIDHLDPAALREVVQRAEERLGRAA